MCTTEDVVLNSIQPTMTDAHDVVRFKENKIVTYLLDTHPTVDMNHLAVTDFTQDDRQHFAQLIGYSVSGWGTLSYVNDDQYRVVEAMMEGQTETQARISTLQREMNYIREAFREPIARIYGIAPEDLNIT